MNRTEFEQLRDLPDKAIEGDIVFIPSKNISTILECEQVKVLNSLGINLILNCTYIPDIPRLKFNFHVQGVGPICRVEVNGIVHREVGRTHKHYLVKESCPRKNLPEADPRPDLESLAHSPKAIWDKVCEQANIVHVGDFKEPRN
jgi:hypothetical protein